MQFYLDGYRPGDPLLEPPHPAVAGKDGSLPAQADVLIVGCGPAGLVLAAQLAQFPDLSTVIVDRRDGPLQVGQADGVACRTVEMLEAFGLANRLVEEAYWVNEVAFWRPDPDDRTRIVRTGRVQDVEEGLSEFPHVIVNQARMLAYLREAAERSPSRLRPHYSLHASGVRIGAGTDEYPVSVTLQHLAGGQAAGKISEVKAKYVVGCDGARSSVRAAIGRQLTGDAMNSSWGVMDVLAVTDFPDIRLKCTIHSANQGNLLIIPREGGYLVRLYIELDAVHDSELLADRAGITPEKLTAVANRVLHPYTIEVKDVGWWSVYDIGQRLCDRFDDVLADETATRTPRVFIAGDACHTHSAKAGQGMNVSMADAWNLGWKLAAVLRGTALPELLHTYTDERQAIAQELIDFDREFATMFSSPPPESTTANDESADPEQFQRYFVQQGRFTAGVATRYRTSIITGEPTYQHLAKGFQVGTRFHSAPVIRLADAKPMQLGHSARADGAWRLYIFADRRAPASDSLAGKLCDFLASAESPITRYTPPEANPDAVLDVRAVFQQNHHDLPVDAVPAVLRPRKGRLGLIDHEKVFCPDPTLDDIFDLRGIDRSTGCLIIVRPDQHISHVLPLDAHQMLASHFAGIYVGR